MVDDMREVQLLPQWSAYSKAGYRPELPWTCCDYADALLGRGVLQYAPTPGDRAKAMSLLDEALAISRELGMRPLKERVRSRREILTVGGKPAPT